MSFNIAMSGLDATNKELNTISNNIANASTFGFKGARTEFSAVYNGMQPGGVEVASISQNFDKNGSVTGTGRSMDLAINGGGFFVTKDSAGQMQYTRSGVFSTDRDNYVVSNNGLKLQGYSVDANGNLLTGKTGDIQLSTSSLKAKSTTDLQFVANFDASADAVDKPFDKDDPTSFNSSYTTKVFDSLGNSHTVTQYFAKGADNTWNTYVAVDGSMLKDNAGNLVKNEVTFNPDGSLANSYQPLVINFPAQGAEDMEIKIDMDGTTQFGADFSVSTNNPNGYTSGDLAGVRVEENGMVYATYTNGQSQLQGQVVLANFQNPNGLSSVSGTSWTQTFASGAPTLGVPGSGTLGSLSPGALEGSNVDLTTELVSLMTAQRNYQANAKTISTSDQLTQALFNAL